MGLANAGAGLHEIGSLFVSRWESILVSRLRCVGLVNSAWHKCDDMIWWVVAIETCEEEIMMTQWDDESGKTGWSGYRDKKIILEEWKSDDRCWATPHYWWRWWDGISILCSSSRWVCDPWLEPQLRAAAALPSFWAWMALRGNNGIPPLAVCTSVHSFSIHPIQIPWCGDSLSESGRLVPAEGEITSK